MSAMLYKWLFLSFLPIGLLFQKEKADGSAKEITAFHPFYISVTEINHNSKDKTLEISCKLFADDLEQSLEKNYSTQLDIADAKYKATLDKLINDYINKHLAIAVDGKSNPLQYVGFEKEKEAVYCYFQENNIAAVKKIDITNSILQDFTEDQINIMHVVVNGKRQSTKLDFPQKQASFTF